MGEGVGSGGCSRRCTSSPPAQAVARVGPLPAGRSTQVRMSTFPFNPNRPSGGSFCWCRWRRPWTFFCDNFIPPLEIVVPAKLSPNTCWLLSLKGPLYSLTCHLAHQPFFFWGGGRPGTGKQVKFMTRPTDTEIPKMRFFPTLLVDKILKNEVHSIFHLQSNYRISIIVRTRETVINPCTR